MAHVGASKIVKPGGEKLDKLEEQVSHVSWSKGGEGAAQRGTVLLGVGQSCIYCDTAGVILQLMHTPLCHHV